MKRVEVSRTDQQKLRTVEKSLELGEAVTGRSFEDMSRRFNSFRQTLPLDPTIGTSAALVRGLSC